MVLSPRKSLFCSCTLQRTRPVRPRVVPPEYSANSPEVNHSLGSGSSPRNLAPESSDGFLSVLSAETARLGPAAFLERAAEASRGRLAPGSSDLEAGLAEAPKRPSQIWAHRVHGDSDRVSPRDAGARYWLSRHGSLIQVNPAPRWSPVACRDMRDSMAVLEQSRASPDGSRTKSARSPRIRSRRCRRRLSHRRGSRRYRA